MQKLQPYLSPETQVTEPSPCPIERIKGKYRYMVMFRGGNLSWLKKILRYELFRNPVRGVTVQVDVDPVSLM
jgi:primosomal protein N' (replication factor Y)